MELVAAALDRAGTAHTCHCRRSHRVVLVWNHQTSRGRSCMHACARACVHVCACVCICMRVCLRVCAYACACMHVFVLVLLSTYFMPGTGLT